MSADPGEERPSIDVREIPQLVNPHEVAARSLLPSFLYLPSEVGLPGGQPGAAMDRRIAAGIVGELARKRGAENPVRLVASAKSWLSYGAANRSGAILPWGAPAGGDEDLAGGRLGGVPAPPARRVEPSNQAGRLEDEDVLLTVPASFDEVARELTVRAAEDAGLGHVTLLEEPQAAFYAWIAAQGDAGGAACASAISCSCATSAAARPTSP